MSSLNKKLIQMESFNSRTPANDKQIKDAELELGLSFSSEYKAYLAEFGCASVYGHELTGISKSSRLDVVQVTISQRALNIDIPSDWYVIEEINIDSITIWQSSNGKVYLKTPNKPAEQVAESIIEYLS